MQKIRRTFSVSKCNGQRWNKQNKEFEDVYFEFSGNYTLERATNKARKETKDNTIVITNIEIENTMYAITTENFQKYGERIK